MAVATLEHVNITVANLDKTANMLCKLFDWHIRWRGSAMGDGETVHVGNEREYIALYCAKNPPGETYNNYDANAGLNHVGIVVDDIERAEKSVKEMGFETYSHADYEPGKRFYFRDENAVEFEVVSYS